MKITPMNSLVTGTIERFVNEVSPVKLKEKADKFQEILSNKNINQSERTKTLEQWIESLEELKIRLENNITKDNLDLYKDSIKRFLNYYVDNDLYLKEYRTQNGLYHSKTVNIIKDTNEKVNQLTEDLMSSQIGRLEILRLTGEIQGLLFQLVV